MISEAEHLASLGEILGGAKFSADAAELRATAAALRKGLGAYTWDAKSKAFINRFPSGGEFYRRVSPTSFYALIWARIRIRGQNRFLPPETNELVLSIALGCTESDTVPFPREPNTPF